MRRPRDYDAELKALDERAQQLKNRRVVQLGELVIASGADALPLDQLAGALLEVAADRDAAKKEAWRVAGAALFCRERPTRTGGVAADRSGIAAPGGAAQPAAGGAGA